MTWAIIVGTTLVFSLLPVAVAGPQQPQSDATLAREVYLKSRSDDASRARKSKKKPPTRPHSAEPMALGFSLFGQASDGSTVTIDSARHFHRGDRVRFGLEPSHDGYLYVFVSTNDGPFKMIYPDSRLNGGENFVRAHCFYDVPSRMDIDESRRWFSFFGEAGEERVVLVLARSPLPDVPVGLTLRNRSQRVGGQSFTLTDVQVNSLVASSRESLDSASVQFGQTLPEAMQHSQARDLGIPPDAPAPSVIRFGQPSARTVTVALTLKHDHDRPSDH